MTHATVASGKIILIRLTSSHLLSDERDSISCELSMSESKMYSVDRQNVQAALDMLHSQGKKQASKKNKTLAPTKDHRIIMHCSSSKKNNIFNKTRRKVSSSGFSRAFTTNEMRKCLMRHDWSHMSKLYPQLLEARAETEPLVWKYIFIQLLYNPKANLETLNHFLRMCVGCRSPEFLQQVLGLNVGKSDSE